MSKLGATKYWLQTGVGSRLQVWAVTGREAVGLFPLSTKRLLEEGQALWDWSSDWKAEQFLEMRLPPDQFHRRIARPVIGVDQGFYSPINMEDRDFIQNSIGQLTIFCRDLDQICRTVHPVPYNFGAYGHDIRNLLILACTEIEAQWKGVLRENGKKGRRTEDYVLLKEPLKLGEYAIQFRRYPWLPEFKPFVGWGNTASTSADIPWYAAYNSVKHDRENSFQSGNIETLFNAIAACAIMLVAQFGYQGLGYQGIGESGLLEYFSFSKTPQWADIDCYAFMPGATQGVLTPVNFEWRQPAIHRGLP